MADLRVDSGTTGTIGWRRLTGTDREGEAVIRIHTESKNVGMTLFEDQEAELRQWLNERHSESMRPAARVRTFTDEGATKARQMEDALAEGAAAREAASRAGRRGIRNADRP